MKVSMEQKARWRVRIAFAFFFFVLIILSVGAYLVSDLGNFKEMKADETQYLRGNGNPGGE